MRNLITDIDGLLVGNAHDAVIATGVTVILPASGRLTAAGDQRGGGPGTRESDALKSENLVGAVDGIFLAGGSSYGLDAGSALAKWLGARGRGFVVREGVPVSPVVPGAILYDLANGGDKNWGETPPYDRLAYAAAAAALANGRDFALGNAGAGYGAIAGQVKGGLGSASAELDGYRVGALAAVNSFGSPVAGGGRLWAGEVEEDNEMGGELGGQNRLPPPMAGDVFAGSKADPRGGENTSLAVIATDADFSRPQLKRLAIMAQTGLARAIRPAHTPFDGDMIFALSTGRAVLAESADFQLTRLGALAANVLARAIGRAVYEAEPACGCPSYRQTFLQGKESGT